MLAILPFATPTTALTAALPGHGYVSVAVAAIWTNASSPRPVDAPALTNPVQLERWLQSMTIQQYRDLADGGRTQTQALYGAQVDILNSQDGWNKVAVPGQPTPKNPRGYPG
jgi:gamma-D-glutamyl-L-lysine dipeptidyl-peptidase